MFAFHHHHPYLYYIPGTDWAVVCRRSDSGLGPECSWLNGADPGGYSVSYYEICKSTADDKLEEISTRLGLSLGVLGGAADTIDGCRGFRFWFGHAILSLPTDLVYSDCCFYLVALAGCSTVT